MAYGRWEPWTQAAPVREHLHRLRRSGASMRAIGRASGASPSTVHRILKDNSEQPCSVERVIHAAEARRLLALTPTAVQQAVDRRNAVGAQRRLRALTALGYSAVGLAARLGVAPSTVRGLLRGDSKTIRPAMHQAVKALYDAVWDQTPGERTGAERRAAIAARARAAENGWPAPMGLDDDQIDDLGYRPRTHWRPATCAAPPRRACAHPSLSSRRTQAPGHRQQGSGR